MTVSKRKDKILCLWLFINILCWVWLAAGCIEEKDHVMGLAEVCKKHKVYALVGSGEEKRTYSEEVIDKQGNKYAKISTFNIWIMNKYTYRFVFFA